jgi:hypothetical protein
MHKYEPNPARSQTVQIILILTFLILFVCIVAFSSFSVGKLVGSLKSKLKWPVRGERP